MNTYKITIQDPHLGFMSGEFDADNAEQAKEEAREFYAEANGEFVDNIKIVDVELIEEN